MKKSFSFGSSFANDASTAALAAASCSSAVPSSLAILCVFAPNMLAKKSLNCATEFVNPGATG